MRFLILIALTLSLLSAENRIALLIGNSDYSRNHLYNPTRDVDLLERKFKELGFTVLKKKNLTKSQIVKVLRDFYTKIDNDTIAVIYFSGHGVHSTIDNKNYLIPIYGFRDIINESQLPDVAISDSYLLGSTRGAKFSILLLDACRSNDFAVARGDRGLGQPQSRLNNDYVISYATEVGKTAKDGDTNSPYAKALAEFLTKPYSIGDIFTKVRAKVSKMTRGKQKPYYAPHFENILYLSGNIPPPPPPPNEPQMVRIEKGSFIMGSNSGESDEKPPHRVTIDYDFEIGKYEVTVGEFKKFISDTNYKTQAEKGDGCYVYANGDWGKKSDANWKNPYFQQSDNEPVVCISWNDAKAYTKWLSRKTGKNYRLPTEAEWEFVARAGTSSKWSFGDNKSDLKKYANIADSSTSFSWKENWNDGYKNTAPIGSFRPNPWGVYDMHGNVWEWCEDWYLDSYNSTPKDGSANHSQNKNRKVLRGGSWYYDATNSRSANRYWYYPSYRDNFVGFRLQRTLP